MTSRWPQDSNIKNLTICCTSRWTKHTLKVGKKSVRNCGWDGCINITEIWTWYYTSFCDLVTWSEVTWSNFFFVKKNCPISYIKFGGAVRRRFYAIFEKPQGVASTPLGWARINISEHVMASTEFTCGINLGAYFSCDLGIGGYNESSGASRRPLNCCFDEEALRGRYHRSSIDCCRLTWNV